MCIYIYIGSQIRCITGDASTPGKFAPSPLAGLQCNPPTQPRAIVVVFICNKIARARD